jgi:hypothetical protein
LELYCLLQEWFDRTVANESDPSLPGRLNDKLHRLALLLFVVYIVLSSFAPVMNNVDLGWHVAEGRWMVQHAAIYRQDAFNYPNLGHAVIDEYPLFQVVLYAAWSVGWWGPCLLTAAIYALFTGVLIRASRGGGLIDSTLFVLALGLAFIFLQVGVLLRPHMVTYLGIAVLGVFLLRHRDTTSWTAFWPMALLQIAWTNCHSGFVIGPAMVGLFGAEWVVRQTIRDRAVAWRTLQTWLGAFLLILLACFVNPYGVARFYPPIFQDHLESIRAYVGEMEPLTGAAGHLYGLAAWVAALIVVAMGFRRRHGLSYSFLLLAVLFFYEALSAKKAWPVFGCFLPLIVLSGNAFAPAGELPRRIRAWTPTLIVNFMVGCLVAIAVAARIEGPVSLGQQWRNFDHGRTELAIEATAWMKAHGVEGRLFHRCEDGGWLQQEGFAHGETFADTGFGKYDEAFIHEVGLVNERPALVPRFLSAYDPDFVVCGDFCFQWPFYLRQTGWRLIFYSPNSSVWTRPGMRPDLPTVSDTEIMASFNKDMDAHGRPLDVTLFGRNLLALNSLGLEDFAFARLTGAPPEDRHAPWYWEAARFLCFADPRFSAAHRAELVREADNLHDDILTAEFRAYARYDSGDVDGALRILQTIPSDRLGNYAAELLLKIDLDRHLPGALALARRTDCFDLRNGRHWQYLAQAEEAAGNFGAAEKAWRRAVFYYPDDPILMKDAADFATRYKDAALGKAIAESGAVYGAAPR